MTCIWAPKSYGATSATSLCRPYNNIQYVKVIFVDFRSQTMTLGIEELFI